MAQPEAPRAVVLDAEGHAGAIKSMAVDPVTTADVLAILTAIWTTRPGIASRVRRRIEAVLDAAKAAGHRAGDNPAAWRGHLDQLLPKRSRLSRGHHAAMAIDDVPSFMTELRTAAGVSARALEFTILTAATKIHAIVDSDGRPIALKLTEGQAHDGCSADDMLETVREGTILLADRAEDSDERRKKLAERGIWANIKPLANRETKPAFSAYLYGHRNLVERFFDTLKRFRAVATLRQASRQLPRVNPAHLSADWRRA